MVNQLFLGDNPFIGVNHLSQSRSRETSSMITNERIEQILNTALDNGASGLLFSSNAVMRGFLKYLRDLGYSREFTMHMLIPDIQDLVRASSEKGMAGLLTDFMGGLDTVGKIKAASGALLAGVTQDPERLLGNYIGAEISRLQDLAPVHARLQSIFLHEIITELLVSFQLRDLVVRHIEHVRKRLNAPAGFATRNFARLTAFMSEEQIPIGDYVVLAPFNKAGFQMNPSRESCEAALVHHPAMKVVVMNLLASGYCSVDEALQYAKTLPASISIVVGASTVEQARVTFSKLTELTK